MIWLYRFSNAGIVLVALTLSYYTFLASLDASSSEDIAFLIFLAFLTASPLLLPLITLASWSSNRLGHPSLVSRHPTLYKFLFWTSITITTLLVIFFMMLITYPPDFGSVR